MQIAHGFHLTYCTNIHAADGWDAVLANIRRYAPALKARLSPAAPFGIGLRLSAREARELRDGGRLRDLRTFLDDEGLYVAIINGFPYGPFHGRPVKADVYAPDWRDDARVDYTIDLAHILAALLPDGVDGGVSTAPLSYKPWMADATAADWRDITRQVARVAAEMARIRSERGALIHLDIEPEPDCSIENTDESVAVLHQPADAARRPGARRRDGPDRRRPPANCSGSTSSCASTAATSPSSTEDPAAALRQLAAAGIGIGRVQLSSALTVRFSAVRRGVGGRLPRALDASPTPPTCTRWWNGSLDGLTHYPDLDVALGRPGGTAGREWRIHFHVPLFAREYETFGSTQDYVRKVLALAAAAPFTRHLEIETYTWDVLPPGLKVDLLESIAREYQWVLEAMERRDIAD